MTALVVIDAMVQIESFAVALTGLGVVLIFSTRGVE